MQVDWLKELVFNVEALFRHRAKVYGLCLVSTSAVLSAITAFFLESFDSRLFFAIIVLHVLGTIPLMFYLLYSKKRLWYYGVLTALLAIFSPMYGLGSFWILKLPALVFMCLAVRKARGEALSGSTPSLD